MRQLLLVGFFLWAWVAPAYAYDPIIEMVLQKTVMGKLAAGNRAVVDPARIELQDFSLPNYFKQVHLSKPSVKSQPLSAVTRKNYLIVNDPYRFQSLISVTDAATGKEIKRISVGRRAKRLLANSAINRIYVLCGGYFSSIWEIDTVRDVVIRKLPSFTASQELSFQSGGVLWNPADIALMPSGNTLVAGSGQLQVIDLVTARIKQQVALPPGTFQVRQLYPMGNQLLGVIAENMAHQQVSYLYNLQTRQFSASSLGRIAINPFMVSLKVTQMPPVLNFSHLGFIGSKNADFVYVLDLLTKQVAGLIPVDFAADDLLMVQDRTRLFVYHRAFGQISIVDLVKDSPTRFTVVGRIIDPRLRSSVEKPYQLAQDAEETYLWDGHGQVLASINIRNHYPRIGIPFQVKLTAPAEKTWVSTPAHKRFYLRKGQLYYEDQNPHSSKSLAAQPLPIGKWVKNILLSQDQLHLFVLEGDTNQVLVWNTVDDYLEYTLNVGKNPDGLLLAHQTLFTLNADEGSVTMINLANHQIEKMLVLDVGLHQPYIVTLYDEKQAQLINLELPRFFKNATQLVG